MDSPGQDFGVRGKEEGERVEELDGARPALDRSGDSD